LQAKKKPKETNIVCFAAKKQWICAPEGEQELANQKASKLLETTSDIDMSDVVIKPIIMPKFDTPASPLKDPLESNHQASMTTSDTPIENGVKETHIEKSASLIQEKPIAENPYANLWSHQLIGVSTPQSAVKYVRKNNLNKDDILIIKSERKGMDWWIILFGLYKDKQTGLENETNLPANSKPWLRPLKNLQVNGFIEKF